MWLCPDACMRCVNVHTVFAFNFKRDALQIDLHLPGLKLGSCYKFVQSTRSIKDTGKREKEGEQMVPCSQPAKATSRACKGEAPLPRPPIFLGSSISTWWPSSTSLPSVVKPSPSAVTLTLFHMGSFVP